jgi:hypothetical protein
LFPVEERLAAKRIQDTQFKSKTAAAPALAPEPQKTEEKAKVLENEENAGAAASTGEIQTIHVSFEGEEVRNGLRLLPPRSIRRSRQRKPRNRRNRHVGRS